MSDASPDDGFARGSTYDGFARYGSGVTLLAVRDDGGDRFLVAASVLTASVEPFALAVSIGQQRDTLPALAGSTTWSLSVLGEQHRRLVELLTGPATRAERLTALHAAGAHRSTEGPLWLPDSLAAFWCVTRSVTPVHDQVLLVGDVLRARTPHHGRPLLRWNREFRTVGDLAEESSPADEDLPQPHEGTTRRDAG